MARRILALLTSLSKSSSPLEETATAHLTFRENLFLEEYRSLREESRQALTAQQVSLQWSLAAIVVVFGAALAFGGRSLAGAPPQTPSVSSHTFAFYLAFGFAVPGLIIGAAMTWMGELFKMERVGCYLRARENQLWVSDIGLDRASLDVLQRPLLWESYLAGPNAKFRRPEGTLGNSVVAFVGGAVIYGGGLMISLVLALSALLTDEFGSASYYGRNIGSLRVAFAGYAAVLVLGFLVWGVRRAMQLAYLSKRAARLKDVQAATSS
jgi:hypothetical protein